MAAPHRPTACCGASGTLIRVVTFVVKRESNTETHKLTNSQTRKMLLQHHQSSETIQGCLASVCDRRSRSEEAGPWRQNRQIRSRGSYEMEKIK